MTDIFLSQKSQIFECEKCDYITHNKKDFLKHNRTRKHLILTGYLHKIPKNPNLYNCECGKQYKHRQSLHTHKKVCNPNFVINKEININNNDLIDKNNFLTNDIYSDNESENSSEDEKLNSKDELIQYLISENKEFKNLILEVCKNFQGTNNSNNNNNNTNTINSHNKTFNLQFFLNETCKDAMNMSEFIDSMKLQLSDLESVGKLGFVDGISNIIIKNLEALDVVKRPVHCSDSKRETMYIKEHDKWEKDDTEMKQMKELVRTVRDRNILLVATWRDLYPECVKSNSKKTSQFNQICMEAFGGETGGDNGTKQEKEDKIISRIAKSVVIDKN